MATEILTGTDRITLVNVFPTTPDQLDELLGLLGEQTAKVIELPGCISANVHVSRDKLRIVNYAQWESLEAFQAMLEHPELKPSREVIEEISKPDVHIYDVVATYEGPAA
jgi:quinol monooxygenase YgiN